MIHRFLHRDRKKILGEKYKSDILRAILFTEKSHALSELKKYVFKVRKDANKIYIKKAIEYVFEGVKVSSINTMNYARLKRRFRGKIGYEKAYKKAIVTLKHGIIDTSGGQNVIEKQ